MKKFFRFSALIITGLLLSLPSHAKDYLYDFDDTDLYRHS